MITFTRNEIVSATQFVRQFATFLKRITESKQEKVAIIKNNEMQAVFITIDEYERLKAIEEYAEQKEIFSLIESRKNTPENEYVSFEDAMNQAGV
jgi:PHD/YefM family antitoxin component YafN of YafNO toxin-antitoxin module